MHLSKAGGRVPENILISRFTIATSVCVHQARVRHCIPKAKGLAKANAARTTYTEIHPEYSKLGETRLHQAEDQ